MLGNIIMMICFYPTLLIMFFVLLNEAKPKKNIVLGVTVKASVLTDQRILNILIKYRKKLIIYTLIFGLVPVPSLFVNHFSITFSIFMIWLIFIIFLMYIPYIKYRKMIMEIKSKEKWCISDNNEVLIDLNTIKVNNDINVKSIYYIPAIIISAIPVILEIIYKASYEIHNIILVTELAFFVCTIVMFFMKGKVNNIKSDTVSSNNQVNQTFTRVRKYNSLKCYGTVIYSNAIYSVIFYLYLHQLIGIIFFGVLTVLYSVVILYVVMKAEFATRNVQQLISKKYAENFKNDDDSFWLLGCIYYNKNDKEAWIDKRTGTGTTINMASLEGKICFIITIISLAIVPVFCFGLIKEEFTPINIEIDNSEIVIKHTKVEKKIDLDEIKEIKLEEDVQIQGKIIGTSMDNLDKGTFNVKDYGKCAVYADPQNKYFMIIKTENKTYVIGDSNDDSTKKICEEIEKAINNK